MNTHRLALMITAFLTITAVGVIVDQHQNFSRSSFLKRTNSDEEWQTAVSVAPAPHMYAPEYYNEWSGKPVTQIVLVNCSDAPLVPDHQSERQDVSVFVIEDLFSLGHMQMSFVQLFAWLVDLYENRDMLKPERTVYCAFENLPKELQNIKDQYYLPFLRDIQSYAEHHLQLTLVLLDQQYFANKTNVLWCDVPVLHGQLSKVAVGRRNCQGRFGWGHCGAWFPSQDTLDVWRHFLETQVLDGEVSSQRHEQPKRLSKSLKSYSKPLQVLILDRASGYKRSLLDPNEIVNTTREILCPQHSIECDLNYSQLGMHREDSLTWQWNCRFWAKGWDVVILVHGAALSNFVCLRNTTLAVVEFVPRSTNRVSMYAPLIQQMGVPSYQTVRFREGADDFAGIVQPELPLFRESLELLFSWIVSSSTNAKQH